METERTFASLGPALRLFGLVLFAAALTAAGGVVGGLESLAGGPAARGLPGAADVLFGLLAIGAGGFLLHHADENAQALAGGGQVLPPHTLLRLLQPRFEHPLGELWSRSDPGTPWEPLPSSRNFSLFWAAGLVVALPLWAYSLFGPTGPAVAIVDLLHHLAIFAACWEAFFFARALAARQDGAWERLRPPVVTLPIRPLQKQETPRPAAAAMRAVEPPPPAPAPAPVPAVAEPPPPAPQPLVAPNACVLCGAALTARRCEACGAAAVAGSFRILSSLGQSGGRRTYLAEAADGAKIVLKELSLATAPDAQSLESFAREARTLRELRHSRLPVYVDAFQEEEGHRARLYLAYRHIEGVSLAQEMVERRYNEDEVLDLVEEILEILRHLHGLQPPLIHRDLKPQNIIRRSDGTLALIDFGVARDLERTLHSGTLVGTVGYMPPEQLAGQVDLTSDLYALGATALHLLVRRPPWELMDGPELVLPTLKSAPVARVLLRRLVAPKRAQRFASAREALAAVRRVREGGLAVPKGVVVGAAAAVGVAAALWIGGTKAPPPPASPSPAVSQSLSAPVPVSGSTSIKTATGTASSTSISTATLAPVGPRPLVSWKGGEISRADLESELRQLPPSLKTDRPWWLADFVQALVRRKLFAAEAEKKGIAAPDGPERERMLARAELEAELRKRGETNQARALRAAWQQRGDALFAAAEVSIDEGQLFALRPEQLTGPLPLKAPEAGAPARLEFAARTGPCVLEVAPGERRYSGKCDGADQLAQALLEPETLQLVELSPGSLLPARFYARFSDDFVDKRQLEAGDLASPAQAAESLLRADVRIAESAGSVSPDRAQSLLAAVEPALRRCLGAALQSAPGSPLTATVRLRVDLRDGLATSSVDSTPPLQAQGCGRVLARPELGGTGSLLFVADLQRRP